MTTTFGLPVRISPAPSGQTAVSDGDWKLVRHPRERLGARETEPVGLYRLATDPAETTNLFEPGHPDAQRLEEELNRFETELASWNDAIAAAGQYPALLDAER